MINHSLLMYHLFDRKFEVQFNSGRWYVNYTDGDLFELNKKLYLSEQKYPIIWLKSGYTITEHLMSKDVVLSNCTFGLITKGDANDLYKKRHETNYQCMLYPLYEKFKEVFRRTNGISIEDSEINLVEYPFNDVTELITREGRKNKREANPIPDIWDAIFIDNLRIKINEDCFPQFKIKK